MPEVSVIIACYNGEDVIEKAIDSALAQTAPDLEVVVVDDGSQDDSIAVVQRRADEDARIRLIQHPQNRGISAARNAGIQAADGHFICFLDQDDLWYADRLETALEVFRDDPEHRIGLVFGNEETRVLETGVLVQGRVAAPPDVNTLGREAFLCALVQRNFVPTAAAMFRRECFETLGPLDERIASGIDDFDMFLRVARSFAVRHVDALQAVRHIHEGNFTKLGKMMPDCLRLLDTIAAEEPAVAKVAHRARAHYLYLWSREQHAAKEYGASLRTLCRALRWRPTDVKCWLALLLTLSGPVGYALTGAGRGQAGKQIQT